MDWEAIRPLLPGLAMLVALTVIFWFVIIRPTRRSQHEHQELIEALTPGDRIVTVGGIYGVVRRVHEDTFELEVADGTVMTFDRRAARRLQEEASASRSKAS
ncbi:MAG: preprotein translocase subunit YajC [Armatimonadota bacterium]